jgi:ribosomal protein S18 acetylase RimI-like enzyme
VISYRTFRNWDPPALVALWNANAAGRGTAPHVDVDDLDRLVFAKAYFDPKGLIVCEDDGRTVGFVHAGFGASSDSSGLSREVGVIAMLLVAASHRRRGIGRELVRRAEQYLRGCGSTVIYAGGMHPVDPFYLGLYGGSEMPGILRSDSTAHAIFTSLGYRAADECLVLERDLGAPLVVTNPGARRWARQVEVCVDLTPQAANWWSAWRYSPFEYAQFTATLLGTQQIVARAGAWEIFPLQEAWGAEAIGIVDVHVEPDFRNQGLGSHLVVQLLRHYRCNGLTLAEVQTMPRNVAAVRLYERLGFVEVDRGVIYRAGPHEFAYGPAATAGSGIPLV